MERANVKKSLGLTWFVLLWHLFLATLWTNVEGASFYGASYVRLPLEDAKSTTEIQFKFKTHRSDAFLFLAAGTTDYCLVLIESGGLKIRINLGAGESEVITPQGLRFDDLTWHSVKLKRIDANLTLHVDELRLSQITIPGRFYELNIHYGLFVGGMGDFRELFLGIMEPYRGCIDNLMYNGIDVFKQAREVPGQLNVHMVTWDCSTEFDATSERPFSLVTDGAFLAFPTMGARNGASFACDLKTRTNTSVLVYNTGIPSESDFVAVEIVNGHLRLAIDKGNGVVDLLSESPVNDGLWHHVEIRFGPTYMEVTLDDQVSSLRPSLGENRHIDLVGPMYVGGIELNRRARAVAQGLISMQNYVGAVDGAFKGCLWNLRVNDVAVGLREAQVTFGVRADCVWEYPCIHFPCIQEATCIQDGLDGFRCLCDQSTCVKPDYNSGYKIYSSQTDPSDVEILELQPLHIKEGGTELITSNHIGVGLDLNEYDIRESGILFHVIQSPQHGKMAVDVWHRVGDNVFTLLDLNSDKVRYTHDGTENFQDTILLELEFLTKRQEGMPVFLTQRHRFTFPITVTPVNDPPEIKLPPGRTLRLAQNTRKLITAELLSAVDSDNEPKDLVYTILSIGSDGEGHLENSRYAGKPAETFTQEDVNNGLISYVHRGADTARVAVKVSDGRETAQTAVLRILAFQLEMHMVNNTGISVTYNSYAFVLPDNLTFVTNSAELDHAVRYDITRLPHYGHLQLLRHGEHWQTVNHFTQLQMLKDKIRYIHSSGKPKHDDFKFTVSCNGITTPTAYDFRITFTKSKVSVVNNAELMLESVQEKQIGPEHLRAETFPHPIDDGRIVYFLLSLPKYGSLVLTPGTAALSPPASNPHRHGHSQRAQKLAEGSNVTQSNINAGQLKYRLHHKAYSVIRDHFEFRVSSTDAVTEVLSFRINHVPSERDATVVLGMLEVIEGERAPLTGKVLDIRIPQVESVQYRIIEAPRHGKLELQGMNIGSIMNFTSHDIHDGKVSYVHDDSEHDLDKIGFLATSFENGPEFQYVGTLPVRVTMKNDMQPERIVDRVFNVVTNGERVFSPRDLLFIDTDLNTLPSDLRYTRRGIPNGAIFHVGNPDTQEYVFTQQDINDGKILFRHNGTAYGRTAFWVSDGKYFVSGILEVRASDPYVSIINNTGVIVKRGHSVVVSGTNLSIDTNLNVKPGDIRYLISIPPGHGSVLKDGKQESEFTQEDVFKGRIAYHNDGGAYASDNFNFEVHVSETRTDGNFEVKIFPASYWEPLDISGNRTVTVDEGQRVTIDPGMLSVSHRNVDPREITFIVKTPPQHGYLATDISLDVSGHFTPLNSRLATTVFDQATINERRVKYVHTERNATEDSVLFDVTNGIITHTDLKLNFDIIPSNLILKSSDVTVDEGKTQVLTENTVTVANKHFRGKVRDYEITKAPQHGKLSLTAVQDANSELMLFTPAQLRGKQVVYTHDGSETTADGFIVVGRSKDGERESIPVHVKININAINDEVPVIRHNVKLEVWQGSATVLTSEYLGTVDNDTLPEQLVYSIVTSPTNGYLAFANKTKEKLLNFTQAMVNQGKVAFVHSGEAIGSFLFHVSDGIHISESQIFSVHAKPILLLLQRNTKLYVFPSLQQTITWRHLLAVTSDWDSKRSITFGIKDGGPRFGKLIRLEEDGSAREVTSFTQDHVNRSLIAYKHTEQFAELVATDSFSFDIKCSNADALKNLVFNVEISVVTINPDGLQQYVMTTPVMVDEGGLVNITHVHFNTTGLSEVLSENRNARFLPRLLMGFQALPVHGAIQINNGNVTNKSEFTQKNIDAGTVTYHHDHSDTLSDRALVGIYLDNSGAGGSVVLLLNVSMRFKVQPINDRKFELLTTAPHVEVVQGQRVRIGPSDLKTVDADTLPQDIRYDIISGPSDGKVVLWPDTNDAVSSFTQRNIDDTNLWYVHHGSLDTASFHFKVSDGFFKPVYTVFNIHIVQRTLELVNNTAIEVQQGTTSTYLKPQNLGAVTNGNRSLIFYEVKTPPQYGHLFMNDTVVHYFSQNDVDHERVLYVQMNMSAAADAFAAVVWNVDLRSEVHQFRVAVQPLVQQKPSTLSAGSKFVLSLDFLDATQLAEKTRSNPLFTILQRPRFGRLKRTYPRRRAGLAKRDSAGEDVSHFTHEDLVNGVVAYEVKEYKILSPINDTFVYVLTAAGVQPAQGKATFYVQPRDTHTPLQAITPIAHIPEATGNSPKKDPASTTRSLTEDFQEEEVPGDEKAPALHPSLTNDHLLIIALAIGVVLLTIVIIVVVKCAIKKRGKKPPKCSATRTAAANGGPLPPPVLDNDTQYHCVPTHDQSRDSCGHYDDGEDLDDLNGSLGHGLTPPPTARSRPTSPRLRSHSHSSLQSRTDPNSSLRATPSAIPEEEWSEVSSAVPTCKVTPLAQTDQIDVNETTLKYPYSFVEPGSLDSWGMYDTTSGDLPYSRPTNPMLRKNQYWV